MILDALAALGIARVGVDGYEADDVIGTLTDALTGRACRSTSSPATATSSSSSTTPAPVRVLYTARGGVRDPDLVDQAFLREKYAVATGPAYADMAVLRGDTSDGLPGRGRHRREDGGQAHRDLRHLATCARPSTAGTPRSRAPSAPASRPAADYLDVAPRVVRVAKDAPVPDVDPALPTPVADPALLSRLAVEYGLTSSFDRVLAALGLGD